MESLEQFALVTSIYVEKSTPDRNSKRQMAAR